jgi:hypothetical protein
LTRKSVREAWRVDVQGSFRWMYSISNVNRQGQGQNVQ